MAAEDRPEPPAIGAEIQIDLPELYEVVGPSLADAGPSTPDITQLSLQTIAPPSDEIALPAVGAQALALAIPEPSGIAILLGALALYGTKRARRKPAADGQTSPLGFTA